MKQKNSVRIRSTLFFAVIDSGIVHRIYGENLMLGGGAVRRKQPVTVVVHCPEAEEGKQMLARCVAQVHGELVRYRISQLSCPEKQKQEILDSVIRIVNGREQ